jgi:hypothetical protein
MLFISTKVCIILPRGIHDDDVDDGDDDDGGGGGDDVDGADDDDDDGDDGGGAENMFNEPPDDPHTHACMHAYTPRRMFMKEKRALAFFFYTS